MARVPTLDGPTVQRQALPGVELQAAPVGLAPDIQARQAAQFNQAGQQIVDTTHRIGIDMLDQANQLRVDDAVNKAKEQALKLTFDKDVGFTSLKGQAALDRPNGQSLGQEYGGNLQTGVSDIAAGLGNDRQRQLFQQRMQPVQQQFQAQLMQHENQEFKTYALSVDDGIQKNQINTIGLNYNNPAVVDDSVKSIQASVYRQGKILGKSAEWIEAQSRTLTSNAHLVALQSALEKNDPLYADQYLKKYSTQMDANDILRANGLITKEVDAKIGQAAGLQVMGLNQPKMAPTDADRLTNLVMGAESGGKDFGPDGKLLTSPKGAQGRMQVMPATAADPGYGIKPAADNSPEELARVGRQKLQAMLQKYGGNVPQALAAYNWGEGNVDKAIKQAASAGDKFRPAQGNDWLAYAPKETQNYVAGIMGKYGAGGGAPQRPTLQDVHQQVRETLGPNARPEQVRIATETVTKQFSDATAAVKQRGEEAYTTALSALIQNGGDFASLPNDVRAAIPPDKFDDAMTFAGKRAAGVPIQTDWNTYTELRAQAATNPAAFRKTDLRQYYDRLAPAQREQMLDLQTKLADPKNAPEIASVSQQLSIAHNLLGFAADAHEKKGKFDNAVTQALAEETRVKKRELNFEERDTIIKRMMLPINDGAWFGTTRQYQVSGTPKEGRAPFEITDDDRSLITAALKQEGVPVNDANITARFNLRHGIR